MEIGLIEFGRKHDADFSANIRRGQMAWEKKYSVPAFSESFPLWERAKMKSKKIFQSVHKETDPQLVSKEPLKEGWAQGVNLVPQKGCLCFTNRVADSGSSSLEKAVDTEWWCLWAYSWYQKLCKNTPDASTRECIAKRQIISGKTMLLFSQWKVWKMLRKADY